MLPPETMQTTFPAPAPPAKAQANGVAPAPSAIIRFRSANKRKAEATSGTPATNGPSVKRCARSNICGKTDFPPTPSTKERWGSITCGVPAFQEAVNGAAEATSAAKILHFGLNSLSTDAIPQVNPPPPQGMT